MKTRHLLAGLVLLFLLPGCGRDNAPAFASGVFEATEVIVSAEATGRLLELAVTEGQELLSGTIIGQIDCRQLELKRQELIARMESLKTRVTDVATQTAAIKRQIDEAVRDRDRIQALASRDVVARKQLDDVIAQIDVLRRQEAANLENLTIANRMLEDEHGVLQVQLEQLQDQIEDCRITVPVTGTVLVKYAETGEYTQPGKPLFKVADTRNMFLRAYITADQLTRMKLGQAIDVHADFGAEGSRSYKGRITWISAKSEFTPKTIPTRDERANLVYAVKIAVENDDILKIGMYGFIPTGAGDAGHNGTESD